MRTHIYALFLNKFTHLHSLNPFSNLIVFSMVHELEDLQRKQVAVNFNSSSSIEGSEMSVQGPSRAMIQIIAHFRLHPATALERVGSTPA